MKRYLKGFLDLLPQQSFFDKLEVVLDHNEPDEEELTWVRDFQARYPQRLKHTIVNKVDPIGVSMNRCIQKANGSLLAIWNVDDLRTPLSVQSQAEMLLENADVGIVYGDYVIVPSFGATHGTDVQHEGIAESEFTRSMIFGPFFMFRRSLIEKAGNFDEQLRSGADFDFAIRLAFNTKSDMVRTKLGYYLNEGLGASTRPNSLQAVERTVIELRYGIWDKLDYTLLPQAVTYNIPFILEEGHWNPVSAYVPRYAAVLDERRATWFEVGLNRPNQPPDVLAWRSGKRALRKLFRWG